MINYHKRKRFTKLYKTRILGIGNLLEISKLIKKISYFKLLKAQLEYSALKAIKFSNF